MESLPERRDGRVTTATSLKVAVLVKQVPRAEEMTLTVDGRLNREAVGLEMNAYCRRAVAKGVAMARETGGLCAVYTLGPPSAEEVLREAVAWGADRGTLLSDPAFAGSDTLATARALAAVLDRDGPWDLILTGRNSIDADTGQVGPELAELMDLPFAAGVRELAVGDGMAEVRCEIDDGWRHLRIALPAVLSVAERLIEPCKVGPDGRRAVGTDRLRTLSAAALGPGPWGLEGSPTRVGPVRVFDTPRHRILLTGPVHEQVERALALLREWGSVGPRRGADVDQAVAVDHGDAAVPHRGSGLPGVARIVAAMVEPDRDRHSRELLGEACRLAREIGGTAVGIGAGLPVADLMSEWPGDRFVDLDGVAVEEDVARSVASWCREVRPWALIAPGTLWGREVAGRVAAQLGAGLTGDAVGFDVENGTLTAWKPAFGGRLVVAITSTSDVQIATVRPGVLALPPPGQVRASVPTERRQGASRGRVTVVGSARDDDVELLLSAHAVVAVGQGVDPGEYPLLEPLLAALGAELAATRKVTDRGWLPRARQVGITGHSISPSLAVTLGVSGTFNHMVGLTGAGTVLAVNSDPAAPVFEWADIGFVADWREVVPTLVGALGRARPRPAA